MPSNHPIGIFDSGYGGLTIMREIVNKLPAYDYIYLGDNARAPYGNRSFDTVYQYTLQCVKWFFSQGCPLVILACNTASAKALRTIQQQDLPHLNPSNRVLGVIRPTTEIIGRYTKTGEIGVLATNGTVQSNSYPIEINRFFPGTRVFQQACPMWVPLVENNEHHKPGADFFVKEYIDALFQQSGDIDTLLLGCTHYPLLKEKIIQYAKPGTEIVSQGEIVADSLADYLKRHESMEQSLSRKGGRRFFTTDSTLDFDNHAAVFYNEYVQSEHLQLN